jgi:5-methylcytosine-specific restriction endonuclease McrA
MAITKEEFKKVLHPVHKTFWKKAYTKLTRKMSALKSSLKVRSKDNNVKFDITLDEIKQMFINAYGKECKYCDKKLNIRTIACDHIIPLTKGGESTVKNLQLICNTCNTRKGPLNEKDFELLVQLVGELPEELNKYVMRKLAKGGRF